MRTTIQKRHSIRGTVRPAIAMKQLNHRRARKMLACIEVLYKERDLLAPDNPRREEIDDEIENLLVCSQELM